ncbi:MAG TPA: methylated-DNA--[protein]-cysteine S-methyltransferase [Acidimicrobiales bacterium]|nr:methylated-DNA--[protein]-cysteine S-methyltransferase [Acidimicrobiales bacterium]
MTLTTSRDNALRFTEPARDPAPTWRRVASPVGGLLLLSDGAALNGCYLEGARYAEEAPDGALPDEGVLEEAASQLAEYFAGERRSFSLSVAPVGTDFQRTVWRALAAIPYGETRSYGEIAAAVGRPSASRAVGAANGHNPISVIVPCHRVIGANGSLTGYAGGIERKTTLLDLERAGGGGD